MFFKNWCARYSVFAIVSPRWTERLGLTTVAKATDQATNGQYRTLSQSNAFFDVLAISISNLKLLQKIPETCSFSMPSAKENRIRSIPIDVMRPLL
jgi:hypothetical protein